MTEAFIAFCELELWRPWKARALTIPSPFDPDAAAEPNISFSAGARPLVAVTTNPAATMSHQTRAAVEAGDGPLSNRDEYAESARNLGCFYEKELAGRPTGRRISGLRKLSSLLGYEGVLQVEACPFHSGSLPRKSDFLQEMDENALFKRYVELLGKFLQDRPVVIVQASSKLATPTSAWLTWIVRVAGLNLDTAELVPLVEKGPKTTVAAWVSGQPPKALVLTMGGNNLPGDEGLRKLGARLRETRK